MINVLKHSRDISGHLQNDPRVIMKDTKREIE